MSKDATDAAGDLSAASALLLQDYPAVAPMEEKRTARTPVVRDSLMSEALNIIALNATPSVLEVSA
jgi:hypothetical protein